MHSENNIIKAQLVYLGRALKYNILYKVAISLAGKSIESIPFHYGNLNDSNESMMLCPTTPLGISGWISIKI